MNTIIVEWIKEDDFGYGMAMKVISSDHPRFVKGSRFDFGFMTVATQQGYTVISLPTKDIINNGDSNNE